MADERALVVVPGTVIPGEPRILIEGTGPEFEYILNLPPWTPIGVEDGDDESGPTAPTPNPGETQSDFMTRCEEYLTGEGVNAGEATTMCATAWADSLTRAAQGAAHRGSAPAAPPRTKKRTKHR